MNQIKTQWKTSLTDYIIKNKSYERWNTRPREFYIIQKAKKEVLAPPKARIKT